MILAGDIGGTKTVLAIYERGAAGLKQVRVQSFPSADFTGLDEVIARFLAGCRPALSAACLGVAGPITGGQASLPNLSWRPVIGSALAGLLGLPAVGLINDLNATALGIGALAAEDMAVLQAGVPDPRGARAVIAAGTGLGMAIIAPDGTVLPSEGGHISFAPTSDEQLGLLNFLRQRHGRVSVERVVSGPGLASIYQCLAAEGGEDDEIVAAMADQDPSAVISEAAASGRCALCVRAMEIFVAAYGATAGDLALVALATGGLYIGGGIAPKNLKALQSPLFLESLLAKGRYRPLLERVPVTVILRQDTALLGAAVAGAGAK